ncbi:PAS domain S-box protein [Psychroflexus aestuariivivens]|uniref:PAS domain S-box protein n=1 Tax=Psychroflexus aestuariivivens TaxID=1795040 RepID=UPI000FDA91FC|nr:PAS domain S-box protein [Psychroflexus aestuariivivens]
MKQTHLKNIFLDQSKNLFWVINRDFQLIDANKAYLDLILEVTGIESKLNESVFVEGLSKVEITKWKSYYNRAFADESFEVEEHFFNSKTDETVHVQITLEPLIDDHNNIFAIACLSRDITRIVRKKSEASQMMDASLDVFCTFNKQGEFIYVNKAATKQWGYTPEELIGTPYRSLIVEEDFDVTDSVDASIRNGQDITSFTNRFRKKDGGIAYNIWSSRWDDQAKRFYSVARDGRDKIEQERLLIQSEQRFKALVQEGSDLYAIIDEEGYYMYMSPSSTSIVGIPPEEFIGENAFEFLHPEDTERAMNSLKKILTQDSVFLEAYRAKNHKGEWRWVETVLTNMIDNTAVNGIVLNSKDITEEVKEKNQLKLLESVITNTKDAIIITEAKPLDRPGPKIIYVNDAFTKMTGYEAQEVIGETPRILQGPNTNKEELEKLSQAIRSWKPYETTIINYKKSGEEIWINFNLTPVANNKGEYTHFIAIERDVTEQKNKELEKELIAEISLKLNSNNNFLDATKELCKSICEFGSFDWAELWVTNIEKSHIKLLSHYLVDPNDEIFYELSKDVKTFKISESLVGKVWSEQRQLLWDNIEKQTDFVRKNAAKKIGLNAILGIPLIFNNEVIGVLKIGVKKDADILKKHTDILQHLEGFIGSQLKRKKLENDLSHLFDAIPDIICVLDFQGKFLKINKAGSNLLGYKEDDILYHLIDEFTHPNEKGVFNNKIKRLKKDANTFKFESRFITKKGEVIWLGWYFNLSQEEGLLFATAKNITEEKNLKELNRETSILAKIGSWEVNLVTENLFWSEEVHRLYGTDPNTFIPTVDAAINFYREDYRQLALSKFEECIATGSSYEIEAIIKTSDNKELWVRTTAKAEFVDGSCARVYGSFQDISERKQAEIELRLSEARFRTIFEIATLGIAQVDPSNGRVILVNSYYETITGYSKEEMLKMNFLELTHPDDRKKDWELFRKAALGEKEYKNEKRYIKKDGIIVWVRVHLAFIRDEKGKPVRTVAICEDITERKIAALQLEKSLKTLEDYRFALDQSTIIAFTDEKGVITSVNDNFCKISKYKKQELVGQTHRLINSKYHSFEFFRDLWQTISSGSVWRGEIKNKAKDGSYYWVDTTIVPFLDKKNRPVQYLAIRFDITSRKEAEESVYLSLLEKNNILESISDNFYALDDNLCFSYMNKSCAELLQIDPVEIIGANIFEEYPNLLDTEFEKNLKHVKETKESVSFEFYFETLDSWFQENIYPTPKGLSVYFQDITERIKTQQERNSFQVTLENSLNEIYTFDKETFRFSYANKGALKNLGYTETEIKKITPLEIKPDFNLNSFEQLVSPLKKNEKEKIIFFTNHQRKDKSIYPVEVHLQLVSEGNNENFLAIVLDITEHKKAEQKILLANERFEKVTEATNDAIWDWDIANQTFYRSSAIERFFGKNVSKYLDRKNFWKDKFHSEDLADTQKSLDEAISDPTCMRWTSNYRIFNDKGKVVHVADRGVIIRDDKGEAIRMIGAMTDITDQKIAEEENRFKANLLSMVGQAAIATDLDGVVNYWNKAAETIYGWKQEEALGKNIMQLTTPETDAEGALQIMNLLKKGESWTGEFKVQKKDGTLFPALVTNSPIYDEHNVLSGIIGISSDITQEIINKELLKQYTEELERSNEELEQFAFIASHDLQEPLRMISSFMELLQRKYKDQLDEKAHEYIYFTTDGAKRMKQIILDLLEYSRASRPTDGKEVVNLNEILSEFKQLRRKIISEKSAIIESNDLPTLKTYRAAITQILHCLLDNAIKYSKEDTPPIVKVKAVENKNEWKFYIKDNGLGIDSKFFEKIFIIFQRLHNNDQYYGTGVGLSIAKRHIKFLGGEIWLKSVKGEGSIFYFTISKN